MKHLFIILLMIMVFPALANINAENESPTCDESVLNASNGTANLEINWEPNVIPLRWYSGNTEIHPENTNANSCTYDGALNIPATPPEREGYNFDGWRVRPTMDFSYICNGSNGVERWAKSMDSNGNDYCLRNHPTAMLTTQVACDTDTTFTELQKHEWKVRFNEGDLYATMKCSSKSGNTYGGTWPTEHKESWQETDVANLENTAGAKLNCWCRVTGYKPKNQDRVYAPDKDLGWVFYRAYDSVDDCAMHCGGKTCAYRLMYKSEGGDRTGIRFCNALFTPMGNN